MLKYLIIKTIPFNQFNHFCTTAEEIQFLVNILQNQGVEMTGSYFIVDEEELSKRIEDLTGFKVMDLNCHKMTEEELDQVICQGYFPLSNWDHDLIIHLCPMLELGADMKDVFAEARNLNHMLARSWAFECISLISVMILKEFGPVFDDQTIRYAFSQFNNMRRKFKGDEQAYQEFLEFINKAEQRFLQSQELSLAA